MIYIPSTGKEVVIVTTRTEVKLDEFVFDHRSVETHDIYRIDHEGGQVVIVFTEINAVGAMGLATDSRADWYGAWGRIIFYKPIRLGEKTDASFNQRGSKVSRLQIIPTRLMRERDGKYERLLG